MKYRSPLSLCQCTGEIPIDGADVGSCCIAGGGGPLVLVEDSVMSAIDPVCWSCVAEDWRLPGHHGHRQGCLLRERSGGGDGPLSSRFGGCNLHCVFWGPSCNFLYFLGPLLFFWIFNIACCIFHRKIREIIWTNLEGRGLTLTFTTKFNDLPGNLLSCKYRNDHVFMLFDWITLYYLSPTRLIPQLVWELNCRTVVKQ